jgi:hypothetical protein
MNPVKRDDFIRVGDHSPERRSGGSIPEPRWRDAQLTFKPAIEWKPSDRVPVAQLDLYSFALTGGPRIPDEQAAIEGAAFHPLGDAERDRQYAKLIALPVNDVATEPVDFEPCHCHRVMGNDWYFLPSDRCLFDHECRHRRPK